MHERNKYINNSINKNNKCVNEWMDKQIKKK